MKINILNFNKNILILYFFGLVLLPYSHYFPLRYEDLLLGILFVATVVSSKNLLYKISLFSAIIFMIILIQLLVYMVFNDGYIYGGNLQRALLYIKIIITYFIIENILNRFELKERLNIYKYIFYFLFISLILGYIITFNIFGLQEFGKYYLGAGAAREEWMDRIRDLSYEFRMLGIFGNPNIFAFSVSLMLSYYILVKNKSNFFIDLFIFTISIIAVFLSGSRTALVTIVLLLSMYYIFKMINMSTIKKLIFLIFFTFFIIFLLTYIDNLLNTDYFAISRLLDIDKYSFGGRGRLWGEQINYISTNNLINFLIGYGPLKELAVSGDLSLFSDSQFIGILKNFGFIVFLLFICLIIYIVMKLMLNLHFKNENYFFNRLLISVMPIIITLITLEILFDMKLVVLIMPFIFEIIQMVNIKKVIKRKETL